MSQVRDILQQAGTIGASARGTSMQTGKVLIWLRQPSGAAAPKGSSAKPRGPLQPSGAVAVAAAAAAGGSGWAAWGLFASNSPVIKKKNNAMDRPSPHQHRPQGVTQRVSCQTQCVKGYWMTKQTSFAATGFELPAMQCDPGLTRSSNNCSIQRGRVERIAHQTRCSA